MGAGTALPVCSGDSTAWPLPRWREGLATSQQTYLSAEDGAITAIQERAATVGLNPPLDVARARLALRRSRVAEKNNELQLKKKYEEDVQQLLQKSGWKDSSPAHLRQIVYAIDSRENTCRPSTPNLDQSK
jgi:DNA helicase IV